MLYYSLEHKRVVVEFMNGELIIFKNVRVILYDIEHDCYKIVTRENKGNTFYDDFTEIPLNQIRDIYLNQNVRGF